MKQSEIKKLVDKKMLEAKIGYGPDVPFVASVDREGDGYVSTAGGDTPTEACERLEKYLYEAYSKNLLDAHRRAFNERARRLAEQQRTAFGPTAPLGMANSAALYLSGAGYCCQCNVYTPVEGHRPECPYRARKTQ